VARRYSETLSSGKSPLKKNQEVKLEDRNFGEGWGGSEQGKTKRGVARGTFNFLEKGAGGKIGEADWNFEREPTGKSVASGGRGPLLTTSRAGLVRTLGGEKVWGGTVEMHTCAARGKGLPLKMK